MRMAGKKSDSAVMDLVNGPVADTLIRFSLPFMVSTLMQTLYSTVDTIVVGQFLGSEGLSAVSNGSQLMQLIYMLCIGFANAGQVLIAQAKGAQNQEKIQKTVGTLFYITVGLGLALGCICLVFCRRFLDILGTPPEAYDAAGAYIMICGGGLLFTGFYNMFSAVLRGMGDSRHPLIFVLIASGINTVLDLLFIMVFHWGVAGAAWATVIGQACSVVFSFVYLSVHGERIGFRFSLSGLRYYKEEAFEMAKLGIPMAIQTGAVQFSFLFVSHLVNSLGVSVSAAFGVVQKLRNIPGILTQGLSLGAGAMIGQNLGARKNDRVRRIVWCGLGICTIVCGFFGILFAFAPELCFRMFTQDETVIAFASMCTFTMLLELPGKCLMPPCSALISAQGFASFSMIVGLVDAFAGRVFLCWLLGTVYGMGAFGFFLGYTVSTYLTAIPVFIYFVTGLWKKRALLTQ